MNRFAFAAEYYYYYFFFTGEKDILLRAVTR